MSLPDAFRRVAAHRGFHPAVDDRGRVTTYGELEEAMLRAAAGLRRAGVERGDVVAVRLAPGADCLAALLGVMAAGAAYLPVDVTIPMQRVRRYCEIAQARAIVADEADAGVERIDAAALLAGEPDPRLAISPGEDDLAYVIFTSGSTGEPKGVMCEHGPVRTAVEYMLGEGFVRSDERVFCRTSIGFDPSVWEMFAPLLAGATLVIGSEMGRADPERLIEECAAARATVLQVVPTLLEHLASSNALPSAAALRFVFTGGETLTADLAARTLAKTSATLVNLYGPTETTVHVTRWRCGQPLRKTIPLGRPFPGIEILVMGEDGVPAPAGTVGELFIAGRCVARGYINRPDLTAARFVRDAARPGSRMYRTGDRGRFDADGLLYYDGRADRQVKVSGVRVELDEVENALRDVLGGAAGAVVAAYNAFGDKELVAFVGGEIDRRRIRAELQRTLPAAMLPTRLIPLERFPTLSNGKTDYVALTQKANTVLNG
jgi:amino acid adenylation domain-containing protein